MQSSSYLSRVLECVQNSPRLRYTVTGVAKQTGITAAGTAAGGLLFGPPGAFIGACVGAVMGYRCVDDYSGVFSVLNELPRDQRDRLTSEIQSMVGGVTFDQFTNWFREVNHQQVLLDLLFAYTRNQFSPK